MKAKARCEHECIMKMNMVKNDRLISKIDLINVVGFVLKLSFYALVIRNFF